MDTWHFINDVASLVGVFIFVYWLHRLKIPCYKMCMPNCILCNSGDTKLVYESQISPNEKLSFSYTFSPLHNKTFAVYRCVNCTHQFCYPVSAEIGTGYISVVDEEYLKHEKSRLVTAAKSMEIIKKYKQGGRLLDIGCATGDFLQAAREAGFESEGLEPSAWSANLARKRGFVVHEELLQTFADKHEAKYDVITLWGVIEHFSNPTTEVARIKNNG